MSDTEHISARGEQALLRELVTELCADRRQERRFRRWTRGLVAAALSVSLILGLSTAARLTGVFEADPVERPRAPRPMPMQSRRRSAGRWRTSSRRRS